MLNTLEMPNVLGGFAESIRLLEFDRIRHQLASYTCTVMGQETALSLSPSPDLREVATRQQETMEARQFLEKGVSLEFGPGLDLREYLRRALLGGTLRGEELHAIQGMVRAASYDRATLRRHDEFPLLSGIGENIPDLGTLEATIRSAISEAGEVLDSASPELRRLRQESRAAYQRLNEAMERTLRRLQRQGVVQEPIITQRNGRLVLLIKTEMKFRVPGIIHDASDSGATVFIEPMPAIDLGNQWRELRLAEEREEERVLRQLSSQVGELGEDLLLTLDLIARLDLVMAKGRYSITIHATAPSIADRDVGVSGGSRLKLTGARHPLLSGTVVPISLQLGGETSSHPASVRLNPPPVRGSLPTPALVRGDTEGLAANVMLITGPNAGGKTVTLKTVGLLALMAQSGLHLPAQEANIPLFDGIYADIGDQQSIEQSLSTFSSHILNLRTIMDQATARSLVLLDELGTSTDPEEGSALAKAVLSYFQRRGLLLVATTHHRSVAGYVQEQRGMVNASVDLDPQTLEPTYRVTLGLPGRSYALTIATQMGLYQEIIEHARTLLSPAERAVENLLRELQQERHLVERMRQEAEEALARAKQQQAEIEAQLASIETTKLELVEQARQELQGRLTDLLSRLQQAERSLEQPQTKRVFQEQRVLLNEARRQLKSPTWQPIEVKLPTWQERLQSGDRVFIRGIPRPVEVITPPDAQGQVEVLLGTMRAKIPVYQLERQEKQAHQPAARQGVYFSRPAPRQANTEIDLRGLRVDEALEKLDGFLNAAALDGVSTARVIHGKGTGALRRAIREYLVGYPLVASASPAEGPGGDGVTVVELT